VYFAAVGFDHLGWAGGPRPARVASAPLVRTALVPVEGGHVNGDPTGCGDVFGATLAARLFDGEPLEQAMAQANRMARRNVSFRGATGLQHHLRGGLLEARAS
jgi:sugar/nucleoside kinase (ribokinase family)